MNTRILCARLAAGAAAIAMLPGIGVAQTVDPQSGSNEGAASSDEIVVTGTLIRGIAPVGSNVIGVGQSQIEATGAATTNQLLASIPQLGSFGTIPFGPAASTGSNTTNPISRPNLRNLPAANTSGGAQTLVLIDGHRVVGAGTEQVGVDPDIIAPGAIQRVEAMTDGGSAVYGSDALGGVINFITRKRFDGVEVNGRFGMAKDVTTFDAGATVGKDWGSGGAFVSYSYARHDALYGADREYIKRIDWNTGVPVGRNCAVPNVSIRNGAVTRNYTPSGAGLASGLSTCDPTDDQSFYPQSKKHNVFARLNQDLSEGLSFDLTAIWARRETLQNGGTLGIGNLSVGTGSGTLASSSPFYRPITDPADPNFGLNLPQTVAFNYGPIAGGRSAQQRTVFETFQIVPQITAKLGGDWQLRALFSYGESKVSYENQTLNPTAQATALALNQLNPYNIGASAPAVLSGLFGLDQGYGQNEFFDYRLIADGSLFELPGGTVKAAIGAEYWRNNFERRATNVANLTLNRVFTYSQTAKSAFGELQIPIVGESNAFAGLSEMTLSGSLRHDEYNDFGSTTNPKLALEIKPVNWLSIKGNWGKNFTAPSAVDQLGVFTAAALIVPGSFLVPPPGTTFLPNEAGIASGRGTVQNLQPQTASQWSVGTTIKPPFVPGLTVNASYYRINLKGTIGRPIGTNPLPYYQNYPDLYKVRPTGLQVAEFISDLPPSNVGFTLCNPTSASQAQIVNPGASCAGTTTPVGLIQDTLGRNLGSTKLSGVDFGLNYVTETGFGSVDASVAGNVRLKQDTRPSPIAAVIPELDFDNPKFRFQSTLGVNVSGFRGQVTWNHVAGYDRTGGAAAAANFGQGRVGAFNTVDLFFKYDVPGSGIAEGLSFTVNVQNALDEDPPLVKSSASGAPGFDPNLAFTLGRQVQFGIRKKF